MTPAAHDRLRSGMIQLLHRTAAMGVLREAASVEKIDSRLLRRLVTSLRKHGLAPLASSELDALLRTGGDMGDQTSAPAMERLVERITEALDASPIPAAEWGSMREVLEDGPLAQLLEISETSLRRYAAAERATPQPVAEKLHWLALVIADLFGAYNEFGVRRWFERPRTQLGGKSPRRALGNRWHPEDEAAHKVRVLAAALSGAQPLAA